MSNIDAMRLPRAEPASPPSLSVPVSFFFSAHHHLIARLFGPSHFNVVVFLDGKGGDGAGKNIRFPRQGGYDALVGAVITALAPAVAGDVRLFLACSKSELGAGNVGEALTGAAGSGDALVVLLATTGGAALSPEAAARPPLAPIPFGPRPLPILGNGLLFARGATPADGGVTGMFHLWKNAFTPEGLKAWGPTFRMRLPAGAYAGLVKLARDGVLDEPAAGRDMIVTCDPSVVEELATRQETFPKMWNRENQTTLADFTGEREQRERRPCARARVRASQNLMERRSRLPGYASAIEARSPNILLSYVPLLNTGDGLFTSSTTSVDWQTGHGIIPRFFGPLRMTPMFPPVLDKARAFVATLRSRYAVGQPITNFNAYLTAMTSDAVLLAALGLDAHSIQRLGAGEPLHPLLPAFNVGLTVASTGPAAAAKLLLPASVRLNPLVSTAAAMRSMYADAKATCASVVNELIDAARAPGSPDSLLKAMLTQPSPTTGKLCTLPAMYGHVVNLMIAGHETTAATLGFALYYLAVNPEWDARAVAEIEAVLGSRGEPSAADLPKLPTLEAIFKECLRLHPPVGAVSRDAAADTTLGGGRWIVRRGQRILVGIVALQRREDLWGGEAFGPATAFNPARFMPGAPGAEARSRYAFLPFGFGVRTCAGSAFALMEAKTLLAVFLKNFMVRVPPGYTAFSSFADGGAASTPDHLTLMLFPRPGAPVAEPAGAAVPVAAEAAPAPPPPPSADGAAAGGPATSAQHGTPLRVLYGSNGGTCEALAAQMVARAAAAGWAADQAPLDSGVNTLAGGTGPVIVITSTYNGSPPDNAAKFAAWMGEGGAGVAAQAASGVKFAVFAVGNSQWAATFLKVGRDADAGLAAAGGERIRPMGSADADDLGGFTEAWDGWTASLLPELAALYGVAPAAGGGGDAAADAPPRARLAPAPAGTPCLDPAAVIAKWRAGEADLAQGYHALAVTALTQLQAPASDRRTALLEFKLPAGLRYEAGDHFELLARNAPHLVEAALGVLALTGTEAFAWTPVGSASTHGPARGLASTGRALPDLVICARDALEWLVDLSATPSRNAVAKLAAACPCPPEAAALQELASEDGYKAGVAGPRLALVDLLARFKSAAAGLDLAAFINAQPRLAPRYYSISSSPKLGPDPTRASICVGLVSGTTAAGRPHLGPGSQTVHAARPGDTILGTVRALQSRFRLPKDPATPCVFVGPGTGVAPMIGFLEEREALQAGGAALGPALLFFGCRNEDDFLFKDRLEGWVGTGVLTGLHVAFSRPAEGAARPKAYVQDLLAREAAAVWPLLAGGGHFYVCGDARRMAPDVRRAGEVEGVEGAGGRGGGQGAAYVGAMVEDGRFLMDVWAG